MRKYFVAGVYHLRRLPLGGKLSPKVTDEGAILYPTFPCRKRVLSPRRLPSPAPLGESIAPSSAPVCALGHLWFMVASLGPDRTVPRTVRPPRGRLWGWEGPFPSEKPPPPARPAGGRAVTGVGSWAAGQAEKKRGPPQGPPSTRKGGSREEEPLPPWCSFLRLSPKKAGLPRRSRRGKPRRRAHPAPVQKAPKRTPAG